MAPEKRSKKLTRRTFLEGTAAGLIGTALGDTGEAAGDADPDLRPVASLPANVTRTWIGPAFWANRLQDWRLHQGRIECLAGGAGDAACTVALLTREMTVGDAPAFLSVHATLIEDGGRDGFCGFLVGAGGGKLDWRAAALVQKASGEGGGLFCTFGTDGHVHFREHTSEQRPYAFAELSSETMGTAGPVSPGKEVLLRLTVLPSKLAGTQTATTERRFDLRLSVHDPATGRLLTEGVRGSVPENDLLGGIALVSSPAPAPAQGANAGPGARWAFRDLRTGGKKIAEHSERAVGPVLGALHSLNGSVLKLSAQLMPVGPGEPQSVRFEFREANRPRARWRDGGTARIEPGFVARFRRDDWDAARTWDYRIVYGRDRYSGTVRRDPARAADAPLTIGLFSCILNVARNLDGGGAGGPELPNAEPLGRFTAKNLYFPHADLVKNAARHRPDLLVFSGDQLYEGNPTRRDNSPNPTLDYLYKWYLWVWSFRDLTRDTPTIVQVDDHDVYHGNVWGDGGRPAPDGDIDRGGYRCAPPFVNLVQRTQCSHNPDPFDPTPVAQDIGVYYGAFRFGGVSFALLEDRKWKSPPPAAPEAALHEPRLLGERQERFLEHWGKDRRSAGEPKICLTQTVFAAVHTQPNGQGWRDSDTNGYPRTGRERAVRLLRDAGALILSGDQHLATLVRHGLHTFTDGPVQFSSPAGGSQWQRWFEAGELPGSRPGVPHTGDWTDAWGNKVRMLAAANPKIRHAYYQQHHKGRGKNLGDRRLKSEGYGIVRVDKKARMFVLECWPYDTDPTAPGAKQFVGWPYRVAFDDAGGAGRSSQENKSDE